MVTIKIIAGSTRPKRFNTQVAAWVYEQAKDLEGARVELVELTDMNLPLLDEPVSAASGQYEHDHTKAWSKVIDEADGFVFVTPEYNHGVPGALKNAIDFLYNEWNFKPVTFVSYGSGAGGARSAEHLRGIAGELRMYDLREQITLSNYWDNMTEDGRYKFSDRHVELMKSQLNNLVFWAEQFRRARAEMPKT